MIDREIKGKRDQRDRSIDDRLGDREIERQTERQTERWRYG